MEMHHVNYCRMSLFCMCVCVFFNNIFKSLLFLFFCYHFLKISKGKSGTFFSPLATNHFIDFVFSFPFLFEL